jgi:uncharacterized membrane protein
MVNGTVAGINIHEHIAMIAVHTAIMVMSFVSIFLPAPCSFIPVYLTDISVLTFFQKLIFKTNAPPINYTTTSEA